MTARANKANLRITLDSTRDREFLDSWAELEVIGATPAGGVERQAATAEDGQMREWFSQWLRERGFTVEVDRVGNLFGLLEFQAGAPYVLVGSHLDSQPRGGRFDGAYGVLAGAAAADRIRRQVAESGVTPRYNIAVVDWFNEEGSRFKPSLMGSAVFTGAADLEETLNITDHDGVTVREALTAIDSIGERDVFGADEDARRLAAYAEIHIEQGRELEKDNVTIGLVDRTWAANKYELNVIGAQGHTGATAIDDRQDALLGASLIVVALRDIADEFGDELHTSCGQMTVLPNSPVVVPREVHMHLDLRSDNDELLAAADAALRKRIAEAEIRAKVKVEHRKAHVWPGHHYQPQGVELARTVADDLGVSSMLVQTRAGHDSTNMKEIVPSVMLFVPSVDGISHAEAEYTADEDLCTGVDLLTETLARMLDGALDSAMADRP
ncbi:MULTISPECIES: M20 family metallo-hydrolase [unclassified Mycolicibacterium]|uniref:M20 family metallo-hydrolase n=1 Tax=unclassified Mycolicibacterium TaxID=2636767 RepID=UPI001F4BFE53|nr:M20 family metallo-hydrolase [Mycolicibacterium sp. YH-1]UNB52083.1 M20 family metallo-hydrolase [Mycolicibacterium sp. YH-1]